MTGRRFFDTNVVVYAYDSFNPRKQSIAQQSLADAAVRQEGVISVQVLGEFFHATVVRKKLLPVAQAQIAIAALRQLEVAIVDSSTVDAAINLHIRYQLRYWDALILATAIQSGCATLISEDMNAGQIYHGVVVENPF